jgi:hypothetical protein
MEIDDFEVTKIIEQQVKPNENLIVWTDVYIENIKRTLVEQVDVYNVLEELAKERILNYVTQRLQDELYHEQRPEEKEDE